MLEEESLLPAISSGAVNQRQVAIASEKAARALAADVARIRYTVATDSTGSAAIFFRVLLSDRASRPDRLYQTTERISAKILELVQPHEKFGVEAYFNFRSESEQAALRDPGWE